METEYRILYTVNFIRIVTSTLLSRVETGFRSKSETNEMIRVKSPTIIRAFTAGIELL